MFKYEFFKYCTLQNPIFIGGMVWLAIFLFTGYKMMGYKAEEAKEEADKKRQETTFVKQTPQVSSTPSKKNATPIAKKQNTTTSVKNTAAPVVV